MWGRLFHRRRPATPASDLAALAASPRTPWPGCGLHVCRHCRASFVCPMRWQAVGRGEVWLLLRCGECQTWREVTVPVDVVERFSADVELAQRSIRTALRTLEQQR